MKKLKSKEIKGLIGALIIVVIGIVLVTVGKSISTEDSSVLRNQIVENLSFENAEITCNSGICTYTVDVYNESGSTYELKTIDINLKQEDESIITLVGYIGDKLETEEGKKITASIDKDISNSTNVEYVINK